MEEEYLEEGKFPEDLKQEILRTTKSSYYGTVAERRSIRLMMELVNQGRAAFLLLAEDDISKWWGKIVTDARNKIEAKKIALHNYQVKLTAWNKLSEEERKFLGLKEPTLPKGTK